MQTFPNIETTFQLPSPAGELEVIATPSQNENPKPIIAIICHPHPLHGGTMHNKVVTTIARAYRNLGLKTIRFNFRGVGKSTGSFAEGIGETDDLLTVIDWAKKTCPNDTLWLAGFSFGGYIAARGATRSSAEKLLCIAPQVSRFIEDKLPPITIPWVIIQGEQDEIVSPEEVYAWIETLKPQPRLIRMAGAGHFFHGKLMELREVIEKAFI